MTLFAKCNKKGVWGEKDMLLWRLKRYRVFHSAPKIGSYRCRVSKTTFDGMGEQWYLQEWTLLLRWLELVTAGEFLVSVKKMIKLSQNSSQWYSTQVFTNFLLKLCLRQRCNLKPLGWVIILEWGTALSWSYENGERYNCHWEITNTATDFLSLHTLG